MLMQFRHEQVKKKMIRGYFYKTVFRLESLYRRLEPFLENMKMKQVNSGFKKRDKVKLENL